MSNKVELLAKIKALAERGVGGEATSAEELLQKLMAKYNITEEELCEEEVYQHEIVYWGLHGDVLAAQVIYMITGSSCIKKYVHSRRKVYVIECTKSQKIEIEEAFLFYRGILDKGFEDYLAAFIQVEKLFPEKPDPTLKRTNNTELSEESLKLCMSINKHNRNKLITEGR